MLLLPVLPSDVGLSPAVRVPGRRAAPAPAAAAIPAAGCPTMQGRSRALPPAPRCVVRRGRDTGPAMMHVVWPCVRVVGNSSHLVHDQGPTSITLDVKDASERTAISDPAQRAAVAGAAVDSECPCNYQPLQPDDVPGRADSVSRQRAPRPAHAADQNGTRSHSSVTRSSTCRTNPAGDGASLVQTLLFHLTIYILVTHAGHVSSFRRKAHTRLDCTVPLAPPHMSSIANHRTRHAAPPISFPYCIIILSCT